MLDGPEAVASMVRTVLAPPARTLRSPTHTGGKIRLIRSSPLWSRAARPGRCGMSGPKHNDRSAPSTCPRNMPRHWWTCWSMRCSIIDRLPWPRRTTASRNRMCCGGSTGPRLHRRRRRLYTSQRILDAEQRLLSTAGRRDGSAVDDTAVDLALLEMAANGESSMPGRRTWSARCVPRVLVCSSDRLPPVPARPLPCVLSHWPGPKTAAK